MNKWMLLGSSAVVMLGACSVGGDDGGPKLGPDSGVIDSRYCEQTYRLTGTFAPGMPARDANNPTGCWPVGTWTFSATLDTSIEVADNNRDGMADRCGEVPGTANPMVATTYSFRVDRSDDGDGPVDTFTYTGSHQAPTIEIDVAGDGGGECEGDLQLTDGEKHWTFKADQVGTQITGFLTFHEGQRPNTF